MLKNHPKGLLVAFFANMGERFGYYTMLAIFVLFLQAKYGYNAATASQIFGVFLAFVYFMPLFGGLLADKVLGYGKSISIGLVVMFAGYFFMAVPTAMDSGSGKLLIFAALAVISIGTGLFKGNLQALVGNLYDDPKYSKFRDIAFNIFYMGINIGAMFAPSAAEGVSNFFLKKTGFFYNAEIPALAHKFLEGKGGEIIGNQKLTIKERLVDLASQQGVGDLSLTEFCNNYINALSKSYHYAFGVACLSLIVSMLVFWLFKKHYKHADMTEKQKAQSAEHKDKMITLTSEQVKQRMVALILIFIVVIFFWMAFHQNGAALTFFARDYTQGSVGKVTNLFFDLFGLLPLFLSALGIFFVVKKSSSAKTRVIGAVTAAIFGVLGYYRFMGYADSNPFTPQKFQHFNPFFIVVLTPIIVGLFTWLSKKGKDPSAPKKIGIGMIITAIAFGVMVIGSLSLTGYSPGDLNETRAPEGMLLTPYWLISVYFILTIAELFLSPMGISFVSKVAPPQYKGLMQGGWLAATAIGNYGVALVCLFWAKLPLWAFWAILVVLCLLAATFVFSILKRLENATSS